MTNSYIGNLLSAGLGLLDQLFRLLTLVPGSARPKFFTRGYGNLRRYHEHYDAVLEGLSRGGGKRLKSGHIEWSKPTTESMITIEEGYFDSPVAELLPPEAKRARFHLVKPNTPADEAVCIIMLPATGEMGKSARLAFARRLAGQYGWYSIILTAAFYGKRKPSGQRLFFLETVESMFLQSSSISEEAAMLAGFFLNEYGPPQKSYVCFTGFSFGAAMSTCAAGMALRMGLDGRHMACAAYVGSASPVVFADGLLKTNIDFAALQEDEARREESETSSPLPSGSLQVTQRRVYDEFNKVQLSTITESSATGSTTDGNRLAVVKACAAEHDAFITPKHSLELHSQLFALASETKPPTMKWLWGGHVSSAIARNYLQKELVVDTVQELLQTSKE